MGTKATTSSKAFDEAKLQSLRDLDDGRNGFLAELAQIFLAETPKVFAGIEQSVAAKDPVKLKHYAHKLKGMCLNIGITTLAQHCEALERMGSSGELQNAQSLVEAYRHDQAEVLSFLKGL